MALTPPAGVGETGDSWVAAARGAPRRLPAPAAFVLGLGLAIGVGLAFRLLAPTGPSAEGSGAAGLALFALAGAGLIAEGRPVTVPERFGRSGAWWGLSLALGGVLAAAALVSLVEDVLIRPLPHGLAVGPFLGALGLIVLSASGQEAFFRGWLQPALAARWGALAAVLLTVAATLAGRLALGLTAPLPLINTGLEAALFGLLAVRSGGLLAPVAAHLAWRVGEMMLGVAPPQAGRLVDVKILGPQLWTGGVYGLEGSIAATGALALLILTLTQRRA